MLGLELEHEETGQLYYVTEVRCSDGKQQIALMPRDTLETSDIHRINLEQPGRIWDIDGWKQVN